VENLQTGATANEDGQYSSLWRYYHAVAGYDGMHLIYEALVRRLLLRS
jgi:hypothetical protein